MRTVKYPETPHEHVWWAPDRASWWIGVLFAIGSTCFLVGPVPGIRRARRVGRRRRRLLRRLDLLHLGGRAAVRRDVNAAGRRARLRVRRAALDWWSSVVQLAGTLFFNVNTFHALQAGLDATEYDRLVWTPDALGSICFLVSGCLAYVEVCGGPLPSARRASGGSPPSTSLGCVAFGISAIASYVVPSTGSALDLAAANVFTALGALCFLIGSILLLPQSAD